MVQGKLSLKANPNKKKKPAVAPTIKKAKIDRRSADQKLRDHFTDKMTKNINRNNEAAAGQKFLASGGQLSLIKPLKVRVQKKGKR